MQTQLSATRFLLPNVSLQRKCQSSQPHLCPCCGACIAKWAVSSYNQPLCPFCQSVDRHRAACFAFIREPPPVLLKPNAFVAYFGPQPTHAAALRGATPRMHLQEFDYFASVGGISYNTYSRTTVFADVQSIPLQNSTLDGVLILHVLEHVPRLETALDELRRVLRPGGFMHHETPCYSTMHLDGVKRWKHGHKHKIEDCTASRAANETGFLCAQTDHLWGYSCAHLSNRLRAHKFDCFETPSDLSVADGWRFIGPPTISTPGRVTQNAGRLRCRVR